MDRRIFTISALAALLLTSTTLPALAKDGEDDKDEDEKDSEDGDHGGDDGGNSGSGGSGSGDDGNSDDGSDDHGDDGGDDHGGDDGGDSGSGGSGSSKSGDSDSEHDRAKQAVDASQALPLQEMMSRFRKYGNYTVIDVRLAITRDKLLYVFKFIDTSGNVRRARFDAKTGVLLS